MEELSLGQRIKSLRKSVGWSLQRVAEGVGVSKNSVYKWECDEANPHALNLSKLAGLFDVEPAYLAFGVVRLQSAHEELVSKIALLNATEAAIVLSVVDKFLSPRTDLNGST